MLLTASSSSPTTEKPSPWCFFFLLCPPLVLQSQITERKLVSPSNASKADADAILAEIGADLPSPRASTTPWTIATVYPSQRWKVSSIQIIAHTIALVTGVNPFGLHFEFVARVTLQKLHQDRRWVMGQCLQGDMFVVKRS
jgi:hypothetical protein